MNDATLEAPSTRKVTGDLSVGPQPLPQQIATLKANGFASVINNRPDNEGGSSQPTSAEIEAAARAAGLEYRHLPVPPQNQSDADARRMVELMQSLPAPVFAYCRTGNRAEALYRKGQQLG
jgi:uncharacterized protein (TIGR01244 family)